MTTIVITAFVALIVGYMILYGLWWIFLWLTEYDGLYYLTIVFALGCIVIVVILIIWSARYLTGVTN